jgi:diaminohydroxyphosphoribosylaminopyrimidine deaminase / 5-amino-6-(5-phosphoribosylamino)uracil reductase
MTEASPLHAHENFMRRCLQLARLGAGQVAPNPMVGAVLVHNNMIIGEGYHEKHGQAHAEVNCLKDAAKHNSGTLNEVFKQSTLYVSLEPCVHFGKTPPCTDLIIEKGLHKVIIGVTDPYSKVNGKGIGKLKEAGIEVANGVLEDECKELNKRFFTFHNLLRPYVILKWAQTADEKIAGASMPEGKPRHLISNDKTNRLVHKWRTEEAAILVGTRTASMDNPSLTPRYWPGPSPLRLVVDMDLSLPQNLHLFDRETPTIVFNKFKNTSEDGSALLNDDEVVYFQVTEDVSLVQQMLNALYHFGIQSVIVEGGARLLQSFIDEDAWDEARVITNEDLKIGTGLPAPVLSSSILAEEESILSDNIKYYKPDKNLKTR